MTYVYNARDAANISGLCTTSSELMRLAELASRRSCVVEVGSYLGRSAKALTATPGTLYCVDTWMGSAEDTEGEKTRALAPSEIYHGFILNLWDDIVMGKVIPLRCDSVEGAKILHALNIRPDMVFIDAGHDYEWVTRDIKAWLPLLTDNGIIVGHDLPHPRMKEALNEYLPGWLPSVDMLWEWSK